MLIRSAFRCEITKGHEDLFLAATKRADMPNTLLSCTMFRFGLQVFVYCESDGACNLDEVFCATLAYAECLNGTAYRPMMDIFHNNRPQSIAQWKRTDLGEKVGVLARLNKASVAEYIYYHYQLQEEAPGRRHKYGIIHLHENYIFFYKEKPFQIEPAWYEGKLSTKNTPFDEWHTIMDSFFDKWEDVSKDQAIWRELPIVFDYTCQALAVSVGLCD